MENIHLEDLDEEALVELMNIFQGMEDILKEEEEVDEDE